MSSGLLHLSKCIWRTPTPAFRPARPRCPPVLAFLSCHARQSVERELLERSWDCVGYLGLQWWIRLLGDCAEMLPGEVVLLAVLSRQATAAAAVVAAAAAALPSGIQQERVSQIPLLAAPEWLVASPVASPHLASNQPRKAPVRDHEAALQLSLLLSVRVCSSE